MTFPLEDYSSLIKPLFRLGPAKMATGKSFLRQILLSVFLLQTALVVFEGKYIDKILGSFETILGTRLMLVLLWVKITCFIL